MDVYERTREMVRSGGPIIGIIIGGLLIVIVFSIIVILLDHFGIIKGGSMVNRMAFTNKYKPKKH
jgi:hypothetical protein